MSRRPRRNHTPAFKAKVALAADQGRARRWPSWRSNSTSTPTRSRSGRRSCWKGLPGFSGPKPGRMRNAPPVDVKSLHAKIGELTLENDFLEGALSKAGLLSAKR